MTGMSQEERVKIVIDAASSLRAPVDPPYDLWPAIMVTAGIRNRRRRGWAIAVIAVILLTIAVTLLVISQMRRENNGEKLVAIANARVELQEAGSMTSDHYKALRLNALAPYARDDASFARGILDAARSIASSRDKMSVLIQLAAIDAISNDELRKLYLEVARSIVSTNDRERAISALTRH